MEGNPREPDPRLRLVWEEGQRAVDYQARSLDELRARAAAVLGAASISAAFLGGTALDAEDTFGPTAWVGVVAFVLVGLATAWTLKPVRGWRFHREPTKLLRGYVDDEPSTDLDKMHRELAQHLESDFHQNARKLGVLYRCLGFACIMLVVEIVAFLLDVSSRQ